MCLQTCSMSLSAEIYRFAARTLQVRGRACQARPALSGGGLDGSTITDFLEIRNNHPLPFLDTAADDVAVANEVADGDRLLPRDKTLLRRLGHEHEILATDAVDGDDGHGDFRIFVPTNPRRAYRLY